MAQRLVRVLCPECKDDRYHRAHGGACGRACQALQGRDIYRAVGCKECRMTGYTGRQALFELMTMSTAIRAVLLRGGSSIEVKDAARQRGDADA